MTGAPTQRDSEDILAELRRSNAGTEKSVEEAHKLRTGEAKLGRDARASPVATVVSAVTAGAALFGAGLALARPFGR